MSSVNHSSKLSVLKADHQPSALGLHSTDVSNEDDKGHFEPSGDSGVMRMNATSGVLGIEVTIPDTVTWVLGEATKEVLIPPNLQMRLAGTAMSEQEKLALSQASNLPPKQLENQINDAWTKTTTKFFDSLSMEDLQGDLADNTSQGPYTVHCGLQNGQDDLVYFDTGPKSYLTLQPLRPKGLETSKYPGTGSEVLTSKHNCHLFPSDATFAVSSDKSNATDHLQLIVPETIRSCNGYVRYLPSGQLQGYAQSIKDCISRASAREDVKSIHESGRVPWSLQSDLVATQNNYLSRLKCTDLKLASQSDAKDDSIRIPLPDMSVAPKVCVSTQYLDYGWGVGDGQEWIRQSDSILASVKDSVEGTVRFKRPKHLNEWEWVTNAVTKAASSAIENTLSQLEQIQAGQTYKHRRLKLDVKATSKLIDCSQVQALNSDDKTWINQAEECGPDTTTHILTEVELISPDGTLCKTERPIHVMTIIPGRDMEA